VVKNDQLVVVGQPCAQTGANEAPASSDEQSLSLKAHDSFLLSRCCYGPHTLMPPAFSVGSSPPPVNRLHICRAVRRCDGPSALAAYNARYRPFVGHNRSALPRYALTFRPSPCRNQRYAWSKYDAARRCRMTVSPSSPRTSG